LKTYRAYIRLFRNIDGTAVKPFTNYDLSSPRQLELIVDNGMQLHRDKILEKFSGSIPPTQEQIDSLDDEESERLSNDIIYSLPQYKTGYDKKKKISTEEKPVKDMDMDELLDHLSKDSGVVFESLDSRNLKSLIPARGKKKAKIKKKKHIKKRIDTGFTEGEIRQIGSLMSGQSTYFKNKEIEDCEAIVYWYFNIFEMEEDFEQNDICITSDFVTDFSKFKIPFVLVKEETPESNFYHEIFKLIHERKNNKPSFRQIKEMVESSNKDLTISHNQIKLYEQMSKNIL
jgi:hypothetical protein